MLHRRMQPALPTLRIYVPCSTLLAGDDLKLICILIHNFYFSLQFDTFPAEPSSSKVTSGPDFNGIVRLFTLATSPVAYI